jgi:O-antigen/teichoic acid export membrane protein
MLKLLKNISIYSLGNILNKGVMFLLLPLYTRVLQPADYGKLELVYLAGSILSLVYGLKVESGYNRIYFQNKDSNFRKTLFATGQFFNLFCAMLFASIIFFNANWLAAIIFEFPEGSYFLKLITGVTIIEVMTHIPFNNLRVRQEAKKYVVYNMLKLIAVTALTVYFVAFAHKGVAGVLYAKIIGDSITLAALYIETRKEFLIKFSSLQLKLMLSFSVFLIPSGLSALVLNMSNRYFLQEYQTLDDVGLYSLGAKLAGIIPFLFTEPVKKAFGPHLYELIDNPVKCKKILADFSRLFFAGLSFVALAVSLYSRELVMIMSDQSYAGSHSIVFILSVSYLFLGLAGIIVTGIHITKKTWIITMIWPVSALANILFNIWLIPEYGRMGAAFATMLSVIVINLSYFYALYRVYPVKFDYISFGKILILLLIFNYLGSLVILGLISAIIIKTIILATFIAVIYFSGVFKKDELKRAGQYLSNKKKQQIT